jgi:hypothetical protein
MLQLVVAHAPTLFDQHDRAQVQVERFSAGH